MGLTTIVFTLLRFIMPRKGSIIKANIYIDELIKSLKPGGRSTRVEIPSVDWGRLDRYVNADNRT